MGGPAPGRDVARGATDLGSRIEEICEQTGHDRVHVVGHSLGGLIARYYVQRMGGDARVHTLCTLGTPHAIGMRQSDASDLRRLRGRAGGH